MQRLHAANVTCGLKGVLNGSRCTLSISLRSPELSRLADLSRLTKKGPAVAKQIVSTGCRNMKAFSYCCLGISPHSQIQGSLDSSCLLSALVKGCCWGGGAGLSQLLANFKCCLGSLSVILHIKTHTIFEHPSLDTWKNAIWKQGKWMLVPEAVMIGFHHSQ